MAKAFEELKLEYLRGRLRELQDYKRGDCWHWQGDGEDHPESLTCPILISADKMRELLASRQQPPDAAATKTLDEIRAAPHNGKIYQRDDVDYLLALAAQDERTIVNASWLRGQARLLCATLDELERLQVAPAAPAPAAAPPAPQPPGTTLVEELSGQSAEWHRQASRPTGE